MCTLTYFLTNNGYQLFFNRDEQRSRASAIPPKLNSTKSAIYPIDPQGNGTWLAVNKQGMSLALLNYYHATPVKNKKENQTVKPLSRGQLILSLIEKTDDIRNYLANSDLRVYQPFQLCIFPKDLSLNKEQVISIKWNGEKLIEEPVILPITSSSVDFAEVKAMRVKKFKSIIDEGMANKELLTKYHYSQEDEGKHSVNMQRNDAMTVSISHIIVEDKISFNYHDNVQQQHFTSELTRQP